MNSQNSLNSGYMRFDKAPPGSIPPGLSAPMADLEAQGELSVPLVAFSGLDLLPVLRDRPLGLVAKGP